MNQYQKHKQQKVLVQNTILSVPYFISQIPTKLLAVKHLPQTQNIESKHLHIHYQNKFQKTIILHFDRIEMAKQTYQQYHSKEKEKVKVKSNKLMCEYIKDINKYSGIFYQEEIIYVPNFENKELRDLINQVSKLIIVDGVEAEQSLKALDQLTFSFLDETAVCLEHIYYRWRVYSYLQGDGDKHYQTNPFKIEKDGSLWHPPSQNALPIVYLNYSQRKYFTNLLFKIGKSKPLIQQAMSFTIFNISCAAEISTIILLQLFEKIETEFIGILYLISDILFNTTTEHYRHFFSQLLPTFIYQYSKIKNSFQEKQSALLKNLLQLWRIKFIFDESFINGLVFLINYSQNKVKSIPGLHDKLKKLSQIQNQQQIQLKLELLCIQNGIPFLSDKDETTQLINEYLWLSQIENQLLPQINEFDGQLITDKDIIKIKNKQVKTVCCDKLSLSILLDRNWLTKKKINSVDLE